MFFIRLLLICCFFMLVAQNSYADTPKEAVNKTTDKIIEILKDKELKKPANTQQRRNAMRKVVSEIFDFEEMSKRTLAIHWQKRTPSERKEFVSLFTELLERSYVKKIESYTNEKILYLDERIDGDNALVKSKIVTTRNLEVPIDYRLMKKNNKWVVYDVVIEGVSLVNNYRTQFNKIIRQYSYEDLVKRMKNKQEEEIFSENR
ncbi:MAG: ABC transporter substrate-binding protein [Thermodesulfovibrionales bacterium]|nr:ABC transporter substrate-binding protein [Thermodesulfovibrionales bacterium]